MLQCGHARRNGRDVRKERRQKVENREAESRTIGAWFFRRLLSAEEDCILLSAQP